MWNHVVLLNWKSGTRLEQIAAVEQGFSRLPEKIPEIKEYRFGKNRGLPGSNFDYALVARFSSRQDFEHYMTHPEHLKFMAELSEPIVASHAAVQFED